MTGRCARHGCLKTCGAQQAQELVSGALLDRLIQHVKILESRPSRRHRFQAPMGGGDGYRLNHSRSRAAKADA